MYLPSTCLGLLVEEEATAKVKGNSFPLPPLLISCPFKTGPVRQDNNADYTRSGPENACPQVTAASTLHGKGWVHLEIPVQVQGTTQNKEQKHIPEPCFSSLSCTKSQCSYNMLQTPQSLTLPNAYYNYQTPGNIGLHEVLHPIHLCTPGAKSNTWDTVDFQQLLNN